MITALTSDIFPLLTNSMRAARTSMWGSAKVPFIGFTITFDGGEYVVNNRDGHAVATINNGRIVPTDAGSWLPEDGRCFHPMAGPYDRRERVISMA